MPKYWPIITVMTLALLSAGCETMSTLPPLTAQEQQQALVKASEGPKRLQAGDKIKLTVFGEDRLSGEFPISPAGTVSLPLAGTVKAAGLTNAQF